MSPVHVAAFIVWESEYAKSPILPFDIWKAPSFGILLIMVTCSFMAMDIFLCYFSLFSLTVRNYSIIKGAAYYQPLTFIGTAAAFLSAWLVPRVPAQYIVAVGNLA